MDQKKYMGKRPFDRIWETEKSDVKNKIKLLSLKL